MDNNIAIKVENITKIYHLYDQPQDRIKELFHPLRKDYHHDFYALNDVSFEVRKGETVGILGKNGAGKSTILKVITGVITPTSGSLEVNGKISSLLELGTGFNPEYSGLENIYFNGTFMGFTREEMDTKVDSIIEFADIDDYIHQPVRTYSSGMFARLAFSVAINVEPELLIIDEALSVGDGLFQHKCTNQMKKMMKNGVTILFVSHSIEAIKSLCQRAVWLENGSVKMIGDATQLANIYQNEVFLDQNKTIEDENPIQHNATVEVAEQDDSIKTRLGNSIFSDISVDILDKHNKKTKFLHLKEDFSIRVKFFCYEAIDNLSVGLLIKDQYGIELTGESIFNKFQKSIFCKANSYFSVTFKSKMLLRGGQTYSIGLRINRVSKWDRSDNITLYSDEAITVFEAVYDPLNPMWFKFHQDFEVIIDE